MPARLVPMWVLLAACGNSAETCPRFDGVYLTRYSEISGDCGALPDDLDANDAAPEPALPDGCAVRHASESQDGCDIERDVECPEDFADGTSGTVRSVVSLHKLGGDEAWGTLELRLRAADGSEICRSVYDVEITRR